MSRRHEEIVKLWGTSEQFFKELETFLKTHEKADSQTYDTERCLVSVTYYFRPYQVWYENNQMIEALKEQDET